MCVAFIFVGFIFGCCVLKKKEKKKNKPQTPPLFFPISHLAQLHPQPTSLPPIFFLSSLTSAGPPLFPGPTATADPLYPLPLSLADTAAPRVRPVFYLSPPPAPGHGRPRRPLSGLPGLSSPLHRAAHQCAVPRARTASPLPLPPRRTEPHHHSWRPSECPRPTAMSSSPLSPSTL
jgi:hypothetical protein